MPANALPSVIARHADKWFFFVLFVIGCVTIVAFDYVHISKFGAVITCIVLLVIYAACTSLVPALRLRPDQAADNSYYLGLLYTLTSLGVALFRFSTEDIAASAILRNFGIAIATTIVGLGLRVFLSQFREDPDDLEFESRAALAETVRKLRGTLDVSIAEMQGFASGARQAMSEVQETANTSTIDTLARAVQRFEASADDMGKRFEATSSAFEARVGAFDHSVGQIVSAVESLTERISSVRAEPGMIEQGLKPAFDELSSRVSAFAASFEADQQRMTSGLDSLSRLGAAIDAFAGSSEAIARSAAALGNVSTTIGESAESFRMLDEASRSAAVAASSYTDQVTRVAEAQALQGRAVIDALDQATRDLSSKTHGSLAQIDQSAAEVARSIAKLNEEFSGSSEAVLRVRRELAELAGWIVARLDQK